jgi:hypothetical protein
MGGGGISFWYYSPYGPLSSPPLINNTIIAGNTNFASGPSDVEGNGFDSSSGHNLIGYDPLGIFSSGTGNIRGTSSAIDPHLAALDFYGGKTRTMALLSNSLAIDSGDNAFVDDEEIDRDQRGEYYLRVVDWDLDTDAVVDIGAFELAISELYT